MQSPMQGRLSGREPCGDARETQQCAPYPLVARPVFIPCPRYQFPRAPSPRISPPPHSTRTPHLLRLVRLLSALISDSENAVVSQHLRMGGGRTGGWSSWSGGPGWQGWRGVAVVSQHLIEGPGRGSGAHINLLSSGLFSSIPLHPLPSIHPSACVSPPPRPSPPPPFSLRLLAPSPL